MQPDLPWWADPNHGSQLRLEADGIWHDPVASGTYADLPGHEEQAIIDLLSRRPWREALRERLADNLWLRDIVTDPRRPAAILKIPLTPGSRILDVGSGWGQLAIPLAARGHHVTALDQAPNRLRLLKAIADQENVSCDRIHGDIESAPLKPESFDLIILNGVLEWTVRDHTAVSPSTHQVAVLKRCRSLLTHRGKIFLAIENALGLKYLMGAREDHCGRPWIGLMDDQQADQAWRALGASGIKARIHDLEGYRQIFTQAGVTENMTWACFPDYKLPTHVIPLEEIDSFLISSTVWTEHHGDNGAPLSSEWPIRTAYQRLARLGCGAAVAPSYAFLLSDSARLDS